MSNAAITAAFPRWLAITGGGVDVVIDGGTAIKGVQTDEQNAVGFGATIDAAETSGLRVLASEAGSVTATSRITVDGDAVF